MAAGDGKDGLLAATTMAGWRPDKSKVGNLVTATQGREASQDKNGSLVTAR